MVAWIFAILVIILVIKIIFYLDSQRLRREIELSEQNRKQIIARNTSELKTFVLNTYGSDGGYYDFRVEAPWKSNPKDSYFAYIDDFTAGGSEPRWKDRDGSNWEMLKSSSSDEWQWPGDGYNLQARDFTLDVNTLWCESLKITRNPFSGKWRFRIIPPSNGDYEYKGYYDTPYQAKLAGQKFG